MTRPARCGSTSSTSRDAAYTGKRWTYQLDDPANAIGDAIAVDGNRFLVIERDNGQGDAAKFKRIYLADMRDRDHDGTLDKTLVADLMDIANPRHLGGFGEHLPFPFQTIEDVVILDDRTLGVLNDNNFPFSAGRTPGQAGQQRVHHHQADRPLDADKRILRRYSPDARGGQTDRLPTPAVGHPSAVGRLCTTNSSISNRPTRNSRTTARRIARRPMTSAPTATAPIASAPTARAPIDAAPAARAPVAAAPVATAPLARVPVNRIRLTSRFIAPLSGYRWPPRWRRSTIHP